MRTLCFIALGVAVLPEVIRLANDERDRAETRREAEKRRAFEAEQKQLDRANERECARISVKAS